MEHSLCSTAASAATTAASGRFYSLGDFPAFQWKPTAATSTPTTTPPPPPPPQPSTQEQLFLAYSSAMAQNLARAAKWHSIQQQQTGLHHQHHQPRCQQPRQPRRPSSVPNSAAYSSIYGTSHARQTSWLQDSDTSTNTNSTNSTIRRGSGSKSADPSFQCLQGLRHPLSRSHGRIFASSRSRQKISRYVPYASDGSDSDSDADAASAASAASAAFAAATATPAQCVQQPALAGSSSYKHSEPLSSQASDGGNTDLDSNSAFAASRRGSGGSSRWTMGGASSCSDEVVEAVSRPPSRHSTRSDATSTSTSSCSDDDGDNDDDDDAKSASAKRQSSHQHDAAWDTDGSDDGTPCAKRPHLTPTHGAERGQHGQQQETEEETSEEAGVGGGGEHSSACTSSSASVSSSPRVQRRRTIPASTSATLSPSPSQHTDAHVEAVLPSGADSGDDVGADWRVQHCTASALHLSRDQLHAVRTATEDTLFQFDEAAEAITWRAAMQQRKAARERYLHVRRGRRASRFKGKGKGGSSSSSSSSSSSNSASACSDSDEDSGAVDTSCPYCNKSYRQNNRCVSALKHTHHALYLSTHAHAHAHTRTHSTTQHNTTQHNTTQHNTHTHAHN